MSIQTDDIVHDVIVIGAGPTGLLLAGELATAGARPVVLERALHPAETPKANGVVGRAAVELRRRGVLRGTGLHVVRPPRFRYGPFTLRLGFLRSPLHILPIPQRRLEELLERRAVGRGAVVLRGHEVTGFEQDATGVTVRVATTDDAGIELRARYLAGCDGAHSLVRKELGIGFPGTTSTGIARIARITIPANAATRDSGEIVFPGIGRLALFQQNQTEHGSVTIAPMSELDRSASPDLYIVSSHEERGDAQPTDELSEAELRASLRRVLGADLPFTTAYAARSVVANSRQAECYRHGRAFLAGDAAHIFSAGGSALNIGLTDAIALAETLAAALRGNADEAPLDVYQAQRHRAAGRALAHTRVQHALETPGETGEALRGVFAELVKDRAAGRRIATLIEL